MIKFSKYFVVCLSLYFCNHPVVSQELSYINYNVKDGLAGSTVYDMCQDKDGFLWFATENGLSRFDGTRFKNFTVTDGLPDNEVLKVFADSKNRIWIGTFSKQVCYYYNGKMHNKANNSLVREIKLSNSVGHIFETSDGKILIGDFWKIFEIQKNDAVTEISALPEFKPYSGKNLSAIPDHFDGSYMIVTKEKVFKYKNERLIFFYPLEEENMSNPGIELYSKGRRVFVKLGAPMINYPGKAGTIQYVGTTDGAWEIDTTRYILKEQFLPNKKISKIIEDLEKNIWFCTMGEGVFKLPSKHIRTFGFDKGDRGENTEVYSLESHNGIILAGLNFNKAATISPGRGHLGNYRVQELLFSDIRNDYNRLYCSQSLRTGQIILGFDRGIIKKKGKNLFRTDIKPVKSIAEIDREHILVGTSLYAFKMRVSDLSVADTLWRERCTEVFYQNGFYYIGTLNGLYKINQTTKAYQYLGNFHPALTRRITDIKTTADGTLWVATNDAGIVALRDDRYIQLSAERNNISSNICKALFAEGNDLWIGTNRGLTRLSVSASDTSVIKYSASDGLPSDIINAVYKTDSVIWAGSPAGLSWFSEKDISGFSVCRLKMVNVNVSGRDEWPEPGYSLSYRQSNISFEYAGISMKSAGDITYHYMLEGFDKKWNQTRENRLNYQSLPPGTYELRLMAVNKFGVKSDTITISITVSTPFWRTRWFWILCFILFVSSAGLLVYLRNKNFRRRLEEKSRMERQFAELEQQALQAQMNPHFIFNCLNAIQQFIVTNDKGSANKYLTGFASLVRQTLDNSGKKTITLSEEAEYLKKYLEMEKMRSGDRFEYFIKTDPHLKADYLQIPALLLQPYAENSLRHGINYLQGTPGKLEIIFSLKDDKIHCQIKDNGIGRKKSADLKRKQHIVYESKGIGLTEKRVALLNKNRPEKISIEILDLADKDGNPAGTNVIVKIPVAYEPETEKHYSR